MGKLAGILVCILSGRLVGMVVEVVVLLVQEVHLVQVGLVALVVLEALVDHLVREVLVLLVVQRLLLEALVGLEDLALREVRVVQVVH